MDVGDLITKIFTTRCLLVLPVLSVTRRIFGQLVPINSQNSPLQACRPLYLTLPGHLLGLEVLQGDPWARRLLPVVYHLHYRLFHIGVDLRKAS